MSEGQNLESVKSPEKSAEELFEELKQVNDEVMGLMSQLNAFIINGAENYVPTDEYLSGYEKLNDQIGEKQEVAKELVREWREAMDREK